MNLVHDIGFAVLAVSVGGVAYTVAAALLVGRLRGRPPAAGAKVAPATLLKPLCGEEPGLGGNLESFLRQDYAAAVQVVFGIQDPADPARAVAERIRAAHPAADVELVVDRRLHGPNRKISNLINMAAHARHDLLVLSDADMAVAPDYLSRVAAALAEPGVGAVTCYYYGEARNGSWSRLGAMGLSYGFLPNVVTGVAAGLALPCMGSTIAIRRQVLEEIGGLGAFTGVLADDYEIGRAVRAKGYRVALPPFAIAHGCAESSLKELFAHELRWAVTVRLIDPVGHVCSVITHAFPLAVVAAVMLDGSPYALTAVAAALLARLGLKWTVDRAVGAPTGLWSLMPVRDLFSFIVFAGSFFARAVYWRGARFGVSSNGKFFPA